MSSPFDLAGTRALVTGGSKGLGAAIAAALADAGARVAITSRDSTITRTIGTQAPPRGFLGIQLDVRNADSIAGCFQQVRHHWGGLDVLVNNAGTNVPQSLFEVTEWDWDTVVDTDLKGLFFVTQAAAKQMVDAGRGGRIINIASTFGVVGQPRRLAYAASKGGVVNLTRALALELAPHAVTVNAIAPTLVMTDMTEGIPFEELERIKARIPIGRIATGEDVGAAAVYLASAAAGMVTGHTLLVDGGWTAA